MGFNPRSIKTLDSTKVEIVIPGQGPSGLVLEVASRYSQAFQDAESALQDSLIKSGNASMGKAAKDAAALNLLAACIVGWEGYEDEDGNPVEFSQEAALNLVTECAWIKAQVERAWLDEARFFQK